MNNMARAKSTTSKSAAVRDALVATPDKSAAEIAKDIGVTPGLVYNIKAKLKHKGGKAAKAAKKPGRKTRRKPGRKAGSKAAAPVSAHAALDNAFEFVMKVGGLLHAEQLIDKLKSIKERL
jgi:transposase-like protein